MGLKQLWAEARYRKKVDEWIAALSVAVDRAHHAEVALQGGFTSDRARTEPGERLCGQFNASLSETRRVRVTNWASGSHQTSGGNRVRAGQARSTSHDELQVIDSGNVVITDRRVQFLGSRHNREFRWRALADNPEVGSGVAIFRSSGRQKPLVITFHSSGTAKVAFEIDLALALFDDAGDSKLSQLRALVNELVSHPPDVPDGITIDERVPPLTNSPSTKRSKSASPVDQNSDVYSPARSTLPKLPRGCFAHTPPEQVAAAAAALGFTTRLMMWPGSDALLANSGPVIVSVPTIEGVVGLGVELAVVSGDPDQVLAIIEATLPEHSVVVAATSPDGIPLLDEPRAPEVILHASTSEADLLAAERRAGGAMVHRLDSKDIASPSLLKAFNCRAQLLRPMSRSEQILLLSGPSELVPDLPELSGFDEIIVLSEPQDADGDGSDENGPAGQIPLIEEHQVTVAGEVIHDSTRRIQRYLHAHARTVRRYDMTAGHYDAVTPELIAATRVLSSRISLDQANWLIERGATAPWHLVPQGSALLDADPCEQQGLYDQANALYVHFRTTAPKGIKSAKIYKVLHLMRPAMFPILDSRLARRYSKSAQLAAKAVNDCRPDLPQSKYAYWAAIREDLLANREALAATREALLRSGDTFVEESVRRLSDLRLLDILTWADGDDDFTDSDDD